jgi:hypothetical protein
MRKRFVLALILLLAGLLAGLTFWAWISPEIPSAGCTLERNAAWISADWTAETVDEAAVQQLAIELGCESRSRLFPGKGA